MKGALITCEILDFSQSIDPALIINEANISSHTLGGQKTFEKSNKTLPQPTIEGYDSLAIMSSVEPPAPAASNRPPRHRRGPRRGAHRGGANTNTETHTEVPSPALALRPASVAPERNPGQTPGRGRGRGRGNGRGGRGGRGGSQLMVNGQRAFGGQLTSANPAASEGSLAGDAPEFVPGQPVPARPRKQNPPRRRMSKSQAPDIASRTHEDIANGQYECVICTNEVLPNSKIWTCKDCWSVLHISCVKKWSKNEVSTHLLELVSRPQKQGNEGPIEWQGGHGPAWHMSSQGCGQ